MLRRRHNDRDRVLCAAAKTVLDKKLLLRPSPRQEARGGKALMAGATAVSSETTATALGSLHRQPEGVCVRT